MGEVTLLDPALSSRLDHLIARKKWSAALGLLDKVIGSDYGLLRQDSHTLNRRQAALRYKIDLLMEWGRHGEALAWLCLETDLNPGNVHAHALKEYLKRIYIIDDLATGGSERGASANHPPRKSRVDWDGVAGMRDLKLTLEADILMPLLEPDIYSESSRG